jgi:hypothetical protein
VIRSGTAPCARRRVLSVAALAIAAALALSGCGADLQPGAAATVKHDGVDGVGAVDTTIDEGTVDDLTAAFCNYIDEANKSSQQPPQQVATATIRYQLLNALIAFQLVHSLAETRGLTIRPADVAAAAQQNPPIPDGLSEGDKDLMDQFLDESAQATVEQSTLAANIRDPGSTSSQGVTPGAVSGSEPVVAAWSKKADVDVNPAYGTWDGTKVVGGSGSLSDLVSGPSPTAEPGSLPRTQVCG